MNNMQAKPSIMFVIGSMGKGGAERVIAILANNYAERGWKVDVLMLLNGDCEYDLHDNIKLISIFDNGKSRIKQLPKWINGIRKCIVKNKPGRVVSFIARINIITILACIGLNQRIVVSERNDPVFDGRSKLVQIATRVLYPFADCVVFQTKWAQSCFSKKVQKNSVVVPNPIHVTVQVSNEKKKKIVAVGRLIEQKNHAILIRAFKKVHNNYPEYKLYIYGEGHLRGALTKQIQDLSLSDAVFLPGNISNIHEKIADAEMFVLSSNYEGLSNALLEAMMMGLPCISTDCAGSNEVIINGENGLLVPIGSEGDLIKAIKSLIADNSLRDKISKGSRITTKIFNAQIVINKWDKIIN